VAAQRNPGLGLVITGACLFLFGGALAIPLLYLNHARLGIVAGVGVQGLGLVLIVVGAIRSSRRGRLPAPPPPIPN
jgi:hypothetical protein